MTVTLLRPDKPGVYNKADIYDPSNLTGVGRVVPTPPSIVVDQGQLYTVVAVDPSTYASTLAPAYTLLEDPTGSVISYGNDIFHLYYDNRVTPAVLTVESRCVILGGSPAYYNITRYPGTPQAIVISQHYGVSGNYIDQNTPMQAVGNITNASFFPSCVTAQALADNEVLLLQVFGATGSLTSTVTLHAKHASVINEALDYRPRITSLTLTGTQVTGPANFFVYTQQSLSSLFLSAVLTYDDGTRATVAIDQSQCFLYGGEDFIAAYPGLKQKLLVKYYLSPGELVANTVNPLGGFISAEVTVSVIKHPSVYGGKISVIPIWNPTTSVYILRYFFYTLNRTAAIDVTAQTTVAAGSFSGSRYGATQSLTLSLDLNLADPAGYTSSTIHTQNVLITLQPTAALVRYILRDSSSAVYVYGQDSTLSRRPVLNYDSVLNQYYIPASIFANTAALIQSFYLQANPLFDISVEPEAPTPTHFVVRDPTSGAMIVPAMLSIANYTIPFNVIGTAGSYVGRNVLVEFIQKVAGHDLTLIGVPVDVAAKTFGT